ncbi:MAG: DMT family transporter [Chloroflexota bacterium]
MGDPTGLLLGLFAAGMWGTLDILVAFAGRRVGGVASAAGVVGTSCLLIVGYGIATGVGPPADLRVFALAVAAGAISSVGFASFYTALRLGPVSIVSPTAAVYGGLASLLAVVVLGEHPAPVQALGAVAATFGIALAGISIGRGAGRPRFSGPGVPFALVSLVAWSVSIVVLAVPIREVGWLSASMAARPANALILLGVLWAVRRRGAGVGDVPPLTPEPQVPIDVDGEWGGPAGPAGAAGGAAIPRRRGRIAATLGAHPYAILVAGGFLETGGFIAFGYGLEVAATWLVSLASSLGPLVTVSAGVILFGERPRPVQWLGIGLVLAGVGLVAVGG